MRTINVFRNEHWFLSNFYPASVVLTDDGEEYPSVEHAYQAAKFPVDHVTPSIPGMTTRAAIRRLGKPATAKAFGRQAPIDKSWDKLKLLIMTELVRRKFQHVHLRHKLLETGDAHLEEANWWGDRFWGTVNGKGENHLGKILMKIRKEIADSETREESQNVQS